MHDGSGQAALAAWVRLAHEPTLRATEAHALLAAFGPPERLYAQPEAALAAVVGAALAHQLARPALAELAQQIDAALAWQAASPQRVLLTLDDPAYPARLLQGGVPPLLLYAQGQLACLQRPMLAVVGARQATPAGRETARAFAQQLAAQGWCIASGLARGIDAAAHLGALAAGPQSAGTVAVLGTGIDRVYPAAHRALAHQVAEGGVLLSELPLGTGVRRHHFPQRNRLVAGLAHGVLVVEAAAQSGSLITARLAAELGREVFAMPGSIHSPTARGCHQLIRQGATLTETVEDILNELAGMVSVSVPVAAAAPPALAGLTDTEQLVLAALGYDPAGADDVQRRSALPAGVVQASLLGLELAGWVQPLPGGRWQRCALAHATGGDTLLPPVVDRLTPACGPVSGEP